MKKKTKKIKEVAGKFLISVKARVCLALIAAFGIITGKSTSNAAVTYSEATALKSSSVADVISSIANWVMGIVAVLAVLSIIFMVGLPAMTEGQEGRTTAKKNAKGIGIGLGSCLLAFGAVKTVVGWIKSAQ